AQLRDSNNRLQDALHIAEQHREAAAKNLQKAHDAVEMLTEAGASQLAQVPQMEPVRRTLLEKALQFHQGFLREKSTDPVLRREAARAYRGTAAIHETLGQHGQAEQDLRQALQLQEQLAAQFPDEPAHRQDQAAIYVDLANLYRVIGPPNQAE